MSSTMPTFILLEGIPSLTPVFGVMLCTCAALLTENLVMPCTCAALLAEFAAIVMLPTGATLLTGFAAIVMLPTCAALLTGLAPSTCAALLTLLSAIIVEAGTKCAESPI